MAKELTNAQRDELIEQFVEIQLDNMDTQSLYELATEYVTNSFDRLTDSEIKERIESLYDAELAKRVETRPLYSTPLAWNICVLRWRQSGRAMQMG